MFDNNAVEEWVAKGSVKITARGLTQAEMLVSESQSMRHCNAYSAQREREIAEADELNQSY